MYLNFFYSFLAYFVIEMFLLSVLLFMIRLENFFYIVDCLMNVLEMVSFMHFSLLLYLHFL